MDSILGSLVTIDLQKTSESIFQRRLSTVIQLKNLLERIPKLHDSLLPLRNELFKAMRVNYSDYRIEVMQRNILSIINIDAAPSKNPLEMKFQVNTV